MLIVYVSASLLSISISVLMTNVSRKIATNLRQDVFDKLLKLPVGYFDQNQAGDIISRVSYDIDVISTCVSTDLTQILTSVVTVIGSLFMMIRISPLLSLTTIVTIPAALFYTVRMKKITQPKFSKRSKDYGKMNGFVEEMFSGQKTIQAYAYEDKTNERFDKINLSAAERVFDLLNQEEELDDSDNAVTLSQAKGSVAASQVSFGYLADKTILHDFNMQVKPGKMIAIVGPTGAGKTTIINLLMRFYDVDQGMILVDEKDIRNYTRSSLRGAYAMVLQDTWVFRGTIFENIAFGKEDATMEDVVRVAKAAHIHSFITRLPLGYNTVISEDGGNISKGQKQLLTIARAMLYDSQNLILDEATSNVDTNTEKHIQKAMRELMKDKTCFVIAHRLSTIKNADNILVVNHGDVIEQGTHDELIEQKGFYYGLYNAQFN